MSFQMKITLCRSIFFQNGKNVTKDVNIRKTSTTKNPTTKKPGNLAKNLDELRL